MTDLTEQWKKGELPSGYYYCKTGNGVEILRTWGDKYNQLLNNLDEVFMKEMSDCKIISEVPCYDEYTKLKEELKDYEYQHKQDGICYDDMFCKLELARKENRQLKELLKEARNVLKMVDTYYGDYDSINGFLIVEKINQALGEDK